MSARTIRVAGAALACLVVAAACAPTFASGSTLTTAANGPYVSMSWPAATEGDEGQEVATYLVSIDGEAPSEVAAPATSCVLVGLDPNTTYQLLVTAVDTAGERSSNLGGDLAHLGRVTGSVTTGAGTADPSVERCVSAADTDGDRLPDSVETDTGTFVSRGQHRHRPRRGRHRRRRHQRRRRDPRAPPPGSTCRRWAPGR